MEEEPDAAAFPSSPADSTGRIRASSVLGSMGDKENYPRTRKGGLSKMRKSLAWNNAFFTEEGVLNPMELSMLSGPVAEPNENFLSGNSKVGILASPFTSKVFGGNNAKLHSIEETSGSRSRTRSQTKHRITGGLLSGSNSLTHERPPIDVTQAKALEGRSNYKRTLRPPTSNSQKRIANACVANPTSKIPKLKGGTSNLPTASKNELKTTKGSKVIQTVPPVNIQAIKQGIGSKSTLFGTKKGSNSDKSLLTSSGKNKAQQTPLITVPQAKVTKLCSNLTSLPKPPVPTKMTPSFDMAGSSKLETSSSEIAAKMSEAPIKRLAKPSALRKPSPTLGFFLQGSSSPNVVGDLTMTHVLDRKLPLISSTVTGNVIGCTKEVNMATNSISSSVTLDMNPPVKSSAESSLNSTVQSCIESSFNSPIKSSTESSFNSTVKSSNESGSLERMIVISSAQQNSKSQGEDGKAWVVHDNCDGQTGKPAFELPKPVPNVAHSNLLKTETSLGLIMSEVELHPSLEIGSLGQASDEGNSIPCVGCAVSVSNMAVDVINASSVVNEPEYGLSSEANNEAIPGKDGHCLTLEHSEEAHVTNPMKYELLGSESKCKKIGDIPYTIKADVCLSIADAPHETLTSNDDLVCCQKACELKNDVFSVGDEVSASPENKKSMDILKENQIPFQSKLKAEPFTDEWIAALEAFGEDILKMKSGAVQNSPPEKALSEPSPWSPLKRKNQDVGPYDCTKYTKNSSPTRPV